MYTIVLYNYYSGSQLSKTSAALPGTLIQTPSNNKYIIQNSSHPPICLKVPKL